MNITAPDQMYTHELEFAQDSQWGDVVLWLASVNGCTNVLTDPDCPDQDIYLGPRMYTDDQLGKLDGPGRYIRRPDPLFIKALTPLAGMSKKQRRKARKARRALKRAELVTVQLIA